MVIAPHPDDDLITSAGIVYRALQRGEEARVVYMTNGDWGGFDVGLLRQDEASAAQINRLGMSEDSLIFLAYPDGYLRELAENYQNSTDQLVTHNGLSTTYGQRGLGRTDYHNFRFGSPAALNKYNLLMDLQDILTTYQPEHIYVTCEFDTHSDHSTTYNLLIEALDATFLTMPAYNPTVHKTVVWYGTGETWPGELDPTVYFEEPPDFGTTGLLWSERESLDVPIEMQIENYPFNLKYQAIGDHPSQGAVNQYIGRFVHKDEFFWPEKHNSTNTPPVADAGPDQSVTEGAFILLDGTGSFDTDGGSLSYTWTQASGPSIQLANPASPNPSFTAPTGLPRNAILTFELVVGDGLDEGSPDQARVNVSAALEPYYGPNVAPSASSVTASAERAGSEAIKAIDGSTVGYPEDPSHEWIADREQVGAWIQLDLPSALTLGRIVLFDRPNGEDQIQTATLSFSDGSSLDVGPIDNWGRSSIFEFSARAVDSVRITATSAKIGSRNVGFSEVELFEFQSSSGNHYPVANAGANQIVNEADIVQLDGTGSYDPDDDPLIYLWIQSGGEPVTLSDPAASTPTFGAPTGLVADTILTFELTVDDGELVSTPATVAVTVTATALPNQEPIADAGPDRTVGEGTAVLLDGTASSDPDSDPLTFLWTQTGGIGVTLTGTTTPTPGFDAPTGLPADEILTFSLAVNDGHVYSAPDTVIVTVTTDPPTGGGAGNIAPLASTILVSSYSGVQTGDKAVDGVIDGWPNDSTREWATEVERVGAWIELQWATPQIIDRVVLYDRINLDDHITGCTLTFSDGSSIILGTLDNSGAGDEVLFSPRSVTNMRLVIDSTSSQTWSIGLAELEVFLESASTNQAPSADAGPDQTVDEGVNVLLDGTGSSDPENDSLTFLWNQTGGTGVILTSTTNPTPSFDAPTGLSADEILTFGLVVNDGNLDSTADIVEITVPAAPDADSDNYSASIDCDDTDPLINPGATEITCNAIDENCNGLVDDNPDADGDGISVCDEDCDDSVGDSWATPGEVVNLVIDATTDTITWDLPVDPGGNALVYDVIRSGDPADFVSNADCIESGDGSDTQAVDSEPLLSGAFCYLVRALNGCPAGEGSLGDTSAGTPRTAATCP